MDIRDYMLHDCHETMMYVKPGEDYVLCRAEKMQEPGKYVEKKYELDGKLLQINGCLMAPANLFHDAMYAYVTIVKDEIQIERSGYCIYMNLGQQIDGAEPAFKEKDIIYVPFEYVISRMGVDYEYQEATGGYELIVETTFKGPRELTPAEERLPYAKYYHRYWDIPYVHRPDTIAWAKKCALYAPTNPQDPSTMLHLRDVNKLMDKEYRLNEWKEGFTLFDDGSVLMCTKTEMPGVTKEAFLWWFEWHVKEDIRYMLWCPPSHYGISPSLELRLKLEDPEKTTYERTHGGDTVHFVYEPITIDALSYGAAAPIQSLAIQFHDPEYRGITPENVKRMEEEKIAAVCGNDGMLHFFVENEDGKGSVLYSHFWEGNMQREDGTWGGVLTGKNIEWYPFLMSIAQHANKEFSILADILPQLYREHIEGLFE